MSGGGVGGGGVGGGGVGGGGVGGGGVGGGAAHSSCRMLLMGLHPPECPPHRTTQRWLPSEQVTRTAAFQPLAFHWKQVEVVSRLFAW